MFHLGRDDVALGRVRPQRRRDGSIIALSRTRGENHIHRVGPNQLGHLLVRRLDHRLQVRAELVGARGIAPCRRPFKNVEI